AQQQAQQQAQQGQPGQAGQIAPQGWFGNLIGQVGQPLGAAIGDVFGNSGLGGTIGSTVGQLGRMLPFGVDPLAAAYAQQQAQQQAQMGQAAQFGQQPNAYGFQPGQVGGTQAAMYGGQQTLH
ncbi:MAG: hypothetical protein QFF03_19310, partial [Pseudomonadota bacterium]|nr:hypothetical protein [Pseudomonadota bacterium]